MKRIAYFTLRKQIFVHELKYMLRQVNHLLFYTVFFLGTAVPALFFLSLLAFGIILKNDSSTSQVLFIVWALLLTQSMLLLLVKQAVLGSRYRYFLANLEHGYAKRISVDTLLAFICNPILLLYSFVLVSISPARWLEIPHGFLLLILLLVGSLVSIYKPRGLYWFLAVTLFSIPLLSSQGIELGLLVFCFIQISTVLVFIARNSVFTSFFITLPIEWMFWLSLSIGSSFNTSQSSARGHKSNSLLSVCLIAILFIIMAFYCGHKLPKYIESINFIGAQLIVLCTASLQLSIHKVITTYPLFFATYLSNPAIAKRRYWVSIAVSFTMLLLACLVLNSAIVLFHMVSALICIYCASRLPKLFITTWLVSGGIVGLLLFQVF